MHNKCNCRYLKYNSTNVQNCTTVVTKKDCKNMKVSGDSSKNHMLKYVSLLILTVQNAALGLSMRYARTREGDMFLSSTAVVMAEVVKLGVCLIIVYIESGGIVQLFDTIDKQIIQQPMDTLKVCVPSFVYVIQNNLLYVSASHLDAATYQVTYQLKILTTAMFAVLILKKELMKTQWTSLFIANTFRP
ncbi:hypothetical protein MTP99_014482 [Tenebrio molitor]|nr:hypothetical protein MTP99_014482 [Tenebrio molitor]